MNWQLLLILYFFLGTASYILRRKLATSLKKHHRVINGFFFLTILYPLGLVVASFSNPDIFIGWNNFFIILIGSTIFPVINLFAFRASKDVGAGLFTIIDNLTPIVTILAASLLLGETLNSQQKIGAAIVLAPTFVATLTRLKHRSTRSLSGIFFALACVVLTGFAIVFERWMLTRIDFGAYLIIGWGAQTFWMMLIAWPERRNIKVLRKRKNFLPILGYSVANALRGLCFLGALKLSGNASLVGASIGFIAALVVLAAYFVLKEKEWFWLKIGSAAVGAVGLIILNTA